MSAPLRVHDQRFYKFNSLVINAFSRYKMPYIVPRMSQMNWNAYSSIFSNAAKHVIFDSPYTRWGRYPHLKGDTGATCISFSRWISKKKYLDWEEDGGGGFLLLSALEIKVSRLVFFLTFRSSFALQAFCFTRNASALQAREWPRQWKSSRDILNENHRQLPEINEGILSFQA